MSEAVISRTREALLDIVTCREFSNGYNGWNLPKLRKVAEAITYDGVLTLEDASEEASLLRRMYAILEPFFIKHTGPLVLKEFGRLNDRAREILGLPSVRELDPELDKMLSNIERLKREASSMYSDRTLQEAERNEGFIQLVKSKRC